jgi:hypothetical protein
MFKAHSTRAASTSAASNRNVPISDILSTAGWSNERTFQVHYNKPIDNNQGQFGTALLSHASQ